MKTAYVEYRVVVAHDGNSLITVRADDHGAALTVANYFSRRNIPAYVECRDVSIWRRENAS